MATRPIPVQEKLAKAGDRGRGMEEVWGGELCAAHQDVWAPEVPAGFMKEDTARLPV